MVATFSDFLSNGLLDLTWWQTAVCAILLTHATIISVTIYLHRTEAHHALRLHPAVSHCFRFWLWMTTGIVTGQWAAVHRKHHAKCETSADPHSPQFRGLRHVLFEGAELYRLEVKNEETVRRFGRGTPADWIERNAYARYPNLGISLLLVIDVALFGLAGMSVWAVQMLWIPFFAGGVVNGAGHFWGYRNFHTPDASTNLGPIGILIGGEELHNNHHAFPTSAKLSRKWYEFDFGWVYICMLSAVGLAKVREIPPTPGRLVGKYTIDEATLLAVLGNRHEVVEACVRAISQALRQELVQTVQISKRDLILLTQRVEECFCACPHSPSRLARPELQSALEQDKTIRSYIELSQSFISLWERSNASREKLLQQLQTWCQRAERSGSQPLVEFSLRLRQYD
jgi:stearoyl-CoA desaturase (delta-9 desaturase)